jgi:hypothetical protein
VRRNAHQSPGLSFIRRNSSKKRMRYLSQTSGSFVSHWEPGSLSSKKKEDGVDGAKLVKGSNLELKKSTNKKSPSPKSKRCLLVYKNGEMVYWKETVFVCENGNTNQSGNTGQSNIPQ